MKAIRIQNLRSLVDTGFIELRPLTILLGKNSSGKSSFLRCLPLLRQSIETTTTGPVLWYGQLVDFGSFQEALAEQCSDRTISFGFSFELPAMRNPTVNSSIFEERRRLGQRRLLREEMLFKKTPIELSLVLSEDRNKGVTWTSGCEMRIAGEHIIKLTMKPGGIVSHLQVNNTVLTDSTTRFQTIARRNSLFPTIVDPDSRLSHSPYREGLFFVQLFSYVRNLVRSNTKDNTIFKILESIHIDTSEGMLERMRDIDDTLTWKKLTNNWSVDNPEFIRLRDLFIADLINFLLMQCDEYVTGFASKNRYIAPVRATAERYYRVQDLAVDEVDSQGFNLPMFLRNLTEFESVRFSKWLEENFGFGLEVSASSGHISLRLRNAGSNEAFNLADQGFGYSQIMPVLTQLWSVIDNRRWRKSWRKSPFLQDGSIPLTLSIEQPELHLHPRLQAQLVDAFITAIATARDRNLDLRLILETHSQTIVNRIGERIGYRHLAEQDVKIVVFDKKTANDPTQVRTSSYDENGYLQDWPIGFFEPDPV
jgi:hypothetical protein